MGQPTGSSRSAPVALAVVLTWTATLAALAGWAFWQRQWEQPACELTYMYPAFNKVESPLLATHTGYALREYSDYAHKPGKGDVVAPALFVPGNAGTYHQVRSLASETARLWAAQKQGAFADAPVRRVYLQWLSVDTNQALGAFDGRLLEQQTEFVISALRYLVQRYNITPATHPGVLLVGHSMGGVVARAAMRQATTMLELGPACISLLLTLASPHQAPPLASHPSLSRFYAVHQGSNIVASKLGLNGNQSLTGSPAVPFVSVGGGFNDTQVAHALTNPTGLHPAALTLHIPTDQIPGAWLSPTHASIMWCNQLVKPLSRFVLGATREAVYALRDGAAGSATTKKQESSGGSSSATEAPSVPVALPNYDHAALFLRHARQQLLGSYFSPWLESHFPSRDHTPRSHHRSSQAVSAENATGIQGPSLQQLLATAESVAAVAGTPFGGAGGQACTGPNLLWYSQYVQPLEMAQQPSLVTSVSGNSKAKGKGGSKSDKSNRGSEESDSNECGCNKRSTDPGTQDSSSAACTDQGTSVLPGGAGTAGSTGTTSSTSSTLVLQGKKHAQQVSKGVGHLYLWRLSSALQQHSQQADSVAGVNVTHVASSITFTLRASGIKPCTGFRVRVHPAAGTKSVIQASPLSEAQLREIDPEAHAGIFDEAAIEAERKEAENEEELVSSTAVQSNQDGPAETSRTGSSSSSSGSTSSSSTTSSSTQQVQQHRSFQELVGNSIEVTHLAAWLPPAVREGRRAVRNWTLVDEVIAGLDWAANASWSLTLPASALRGAEAITLWAGTASTPAAFHLSAHLSLNHQSLSPQHTPNNIPDNQTVSAPALTLGLRNLLFPAVLPALGPANLPLAVDLSLTSLFRSTIGSSSTTSTRSAAVSGASVDQLNSSGCPHWMGISGLLAATRAHLQPLVGACIQALGLPKLLHLKVQAVESSTTNTGSTATVTGNAGAAKLCRLHTALIVAPGTGVQTSEHLHNNPQFLPQIASNLTLYPLSHCFSHSITHLGSTSFYTASSSSTWDDGISYVSGFRSVPQRSVPQEAGRCSAVLLRDPTCSYQVSLSLTLGTPALLDFVLGHLGTIWLVMQALLLLCCAAALDSSSPPSQAPRSSTVAHTAADHQHNEYSDTNNLPAASLQPGASFLALLSNECRRAIKSIFSPTTWAAAVSWATINTLTTWATVYMMTGGSSSSSSSSSNNGAGLPSSAGTGVGSRTCTYNRGDGGSSSERGAEGGYCANTDDSLEPSNSIASSVHVTIHSFLSLVCILWLASFCVARRHQQQQRMISNNSSKAGGSSMLQRFWSTLSDLAPWASVLSVLQTLPVLVAVLPTAAVHTFLQSLHSKQPTLGALTFWFQTALLPSDSIITPQVHLTVIELVLVVIPAAVTLLGAAHVTLFVAMAPLRAVKVVVRKLRSSGTISGSTTENDSTQTGSQGSTPHPPYQHGSTTRQYRKHNTQGSQLASVAGSVLLAAALFLHPAFAVTLAALAALLRSYGSTSSSTPAARPRQEVRTICKGDADTRHPGRDITEGAGSPGPSGTSPAFQHAWALLLVGAAAVSLPGGVAWVMHLAKPLQASIRPVPTVTPEDAQRVLKGLKPLSLPPPPGAVEAAMQAAQLVKGVAQAAVSHLAQSPASWCDTLVMTALPLSGLALTVPTLSVSKAGRGSRRSQRSNDGTRHGSGAAALRSIAAGMLVLAVTDPTSVLAYVLQSLAAVAMMYCSHRRQ